jgi:AraC-like DNA-binding protein
MQLAPAERSIPIGPALTHTELFNLAVSRAPSLMGTPSPDQPWDEGTGVRLTPLDSIRDGRRDIVRAAPDLYFVASHRNNQTDRATKLISEGSLMVEFRLCGSSTTVFENHGQHRAQDMTAYIATYPAGMTDAEWFPMSTQVRHVGLVVSASYLTETLECPSHSLPTQLQDFSSGRPMDFFLLPIAMSPAMISAASDLIDCNFKGPLRRAYAEARAVDLLCSVIDVLASAAGRPRPPVRLGERDIRRLHQLHEYLAVHADLMPSISQLVRQFGLNRNKISYGFKYLFGVSITEYVRERQMHAALKLLRDTELSVAEISDRVGYAHQTNFTSAFKACFGRLPRGIRSGK